MCLALLFVSTLAQGDGTVATDDAVDAPAVDAAPVVEVESIKGTKASGIITMDFTTMDGYYQGNPQSEGSTTFIGMGIGFAVTGLFFIYAATNIIIDEKRRMAKATKRVLKAKKKLMEDYEYTAEGMKLLQAKFDKREAGDDVVAEE